MKFDVSIRVVPGTGSTMDRYVIKVGETVLLDEYEQGVPAFFKPFLGEAMRVYGAECERHARKVDGCRCGVPGPCTCKTKISDR